MVSNIMMLWYESTTFFFAWFQYDTAMLSGIAQTKQKKRREKIFGRLLHFSEAFSS